MKLIINFKDNYKFEITKNYKLFQNLATNKIILKKGNYKEELVNYFNEIKNIVNDKIISENYCILKKGLKKFKFNLNNIGLQNFISNLENNNLDELKKIDMNMFEN